MSQKTLRYDKTKSINKSFLKRDILDRCVVEWIHDKGIKQIDLITTQSNMNRLPIFFELDFGADAKKIMLWYSTNSKPIYLKNGRNRTPISVEALKNWITEHWVWDSTQVEFLRDNQIEDTQVLGSMVFQEKIMHSKSYERFVITIFDVTPQIDLQGFYSEANTIRSFELLLEWISRCQDQFGDSILFRIKPKRAYSSKHSKLYIEKIKIAAAQGKIILLNSNSNLYGVISESDLVIAVPFTSPAVIAKEMGTPSVYLAVELDEWEIPKESNGVPVIFALTDLEKYVQKMIKGKLSRINN
jgi:polysaccharide biosynthesis PFTS motif protein